MAKLDAFLKIKEIPGESQDKAHSNEFDLLSFTFGVSNSGSMATGGGGGTGMAVFHDVPIQTYVGKSSPELALRAISGKHFPEAVITVRKAGDKPMDYLRYTFSDCFVTSYHMDPGTGGALATEHWSLNYAKLKVEYQAQKKDGTGEGWIARTYDVKTNEQG